MGQGVGWSRQRGATQLPLAPAENAAMDALRLAGTRGPLLRSRESFAAARPALAVVGAAPLDAGALPRRAGPRAMSRWLGVAAVGLALAFGTGGARAQSVSAAELGVELGQLQPAAPEGSVSWAEAMRRGAGFSGWLAGHNGVHPPGTAPRHVARFLPPPEKLVLGRLTAVQGIMTKPERAQAVLAGLAQDGWAVRGVMLDSHGLVSDVLSSAGDKLEIGERAAVDAVAALIERALGEEEPERFLGHSRGTPIVDRALRVVYQRLLALGQSPEDAEATLSRLVVEVHADAVVFHQLGPRYVYFQNSCDPIPRYFGTGLPWSRRGTVLGEHSFTLCPVGHSDAEGLGERIAERMNRGSHGILPAKDGHEAEPYSRARAAVSRGEPIPVVEPAPLATPRTAENLP